MTTPSGSVNVSKPLHATFQSHGPNMEPYGTPSVALNDMCPALVPCFNVYRFHGTVPIFSTLLNDCPSRTHHRFSLTVAKLHRGQLSPTFGTSLLGMTSSEVFQQTDRPTLHWMLILLFPVF